MLVVYYSHRVLEIMELTENLLGGSSHLFLNICCDGNLTATHGIGEVLPHVITCLSGKARGGPVPMIPIPRLHSEVFVCRALEKCQRKSSLAEYLPTRVREPREVHVCN